MNDKIKNLMLWSIVAIILISIFSNFEQNRVSTGKLSYSQFLTAVDQGEVGSVTIANEVIQGSRRNGEGFTTYMPIPDQFLLGELIKKGVEVKGKAPRQQSLLLHIFINWFPMLLLIGVWLFFMRQVQGGGRGGPMSFGRSRARLFNSDQVSVNFSDLGGIDEARDEVQELVEFLKDPGKFQRLGGKIPRGVLLVGAPGTGKTLLAKAIAGEAKVPFFSISGSEFVEMFVGVGAARVRDLFEQAKKQAPCIIFIDEIDAVGRKRGGGISGGSHDEREQTLNQLLVEMDGFERDGATAGAIVMAATNRADILDSALLRPGRFDRQVFVPLPDIRGRTKILQIHMRKLPLSKDVDPVMIARGTPGFSGADLANLVNEGAIFAARDNRDAVLMDDFEKAKDKLMMGAERRSMVMSDQEKRLTAYHEAGHAVVGLMVPGHDPIYKVTIIPRRGALGVTMFLPEEDRYSYTKETLLSQICSLYGGRIAEELVFGKEKTTTGASNDIEKATKLAREMVMNWGLTSELGPIKYGAEENDMMLGGLKGAAQDMSDKTAEFIDKTVRSIVEECYGRAKKILEDNRDKLDLMADALMLYETITRVQIDDIMQGKPAREPSGWQSMSTTSKQNQLSEASEDSKTDESEDVDKQ